LPLLPSTPLQLAHTSLPRLTLGEMQPCLISQSVYPAGASFFYRPGTLPYEAQEVRAFGLFLADMLARIRPSSHTDARQGLTDIVAACLLDKPLQRPSFKSLASRLAEIEKVHAFCCFHMCLSPAATYSMVPAYLPTIV
jgi:hypothetical protein